MKYFDLILVLSLTIVVTASAQNWTTQYTGPPQPIFSIRAVDENTVWAGSVNGIYLRTTDGGMNWTTGTLPDAGSLVSIAAIDADTAYFTGVDFYPGDNAPGTRIYKTTDGGASFELQYQNSGFINSIAFWDEVHGIAVGHPVGGFSSGGPFFGYMVLTTTNGGADWHQTPAENIPSPLTDEYPGFDDAGGTTLAVAGRRHAWFGTASIRGADDPIRVFRSSDQGQTWTVTNTPLSTDGQWYGVTTMAFKDTLTGFAGSVISTADNTNTLARTVDGGQTWTIVTYGVSTGTIVYVPDTAFQVLAATTQSDVVYSDDGGMTWKSLGVPGNGIYGGLSFVNPTTGWAAGHNGTIAKFNGELPTAVPGRTSDIPQFFRLLQNRPNPFNPATTIQFTLGKRANVRLEVFDILGQEVATLVNETLTPGTHDVVFEAKDLPSGVYLYRIQAGEFVATKKLTLMK